jgi:hypothetical protein
MTPQWLRVVIAFMCRDDSTTGEIYTYLERTGHRVRNITGRMSDARAMGVTFTEYKDAKGLHRYSVDHIPESVVGMIQPEAESEPLNLSID